MKLPNPLKVDRSTTEDFGYVYYFRIVAAAALLSVIGNITAYALDELPLGVIWVIHALPPLIAVLMLHTFATIRASFMGAVRRDPTTRPAAPWAHLPRGERVAAWFRSWNFVELALAVTLALLVGAVLVITLAVSFVSLAVVGEMAGWHGRVAWALPLMLDLPAFAATIGFLKAGHRMSQEASSIELDLDAPTSSPVAVDAPVMAAVRVSAGPSMTAGHDRADSTGGHPVIGVSRAVLGTVIPSVTDTADDAAVDALDTADATLAAGVQDTVKPLSRPADQRVVSLSVSVQDSADTADADVQDTADDTFDDGVQDGADIFADTAVDTGDTAADTLADTAPAGVQDTESEVFDDGVRDRADTSEDMLDMASVTARVIAEVGTTADTAVVERVLELALDGMSARRISDALAPEGPSRTPIAAWVRAAKEQPVYSAALAGRRQLVAVD